MDWGTAHPYACYWTACDYDDNAYVYRELYGWGGKPNVGTGETAKQVAEKIAQIEPADEQIYNAVLDNACWAKPGTTGPGIAEEINRTLYEHHRTAFNPSSKGRAEGANQIRQRLIGNTLADGTQKPALYVFANCIHLIRTLPMLAYDKRNPEAYDTDGEDHEVDALAYLCMARPFAPTRPDKRKLLRPDGYIEQRETSAWTT
jgi:phage terminase large subunit